jgi:hypothetical protein
MTKKAIEPSTGKKRIISAHKVFIEFDKLRFRSETKLITIKIIYAANNKEKLKILSHSIVGQAAFVPI